MLRCGMPRPGSIGDWFTAHGKGINLGYFGKDENKDIAAKLRKVFCAWIDNGHTDFEDENTCILCLLTARNVQIYTYKYHTSTNDRRVKK